jgi:hypothetical protein
MITTPELLLSRIAFYDPKKNIILKVGTSRPCGIGYNKSSIHAEENALNFCRNSKKKNLQIYIWRWTSNGNIKKAMCCYSCTKMLKKYNYENKVFTFDDSNDNNIISAISENPEVSLAYKIKNSI